MQAYLQKCNLYINTSHINNLIMCSRYKLLFEHFILLRNVVQLFQTLKHLNIFDRASR